MAKGRAGSQCGQSTDAAGRNAPRRSISSTLAALNRKAERDSKHRFRSLCRVIDKQMLHDCFHRLKRGATPGLDGVTVEEYEKDLESNLESLPGRLIGKRRYIPKSNGKPRLLGIPALEDKIVRLAASRILESIHETDFSERSVGYRKGMPGARQSSHQLGRELYGGTCRWIVVGDIRSFLDEVDHDWLIRMLEPRVDDRAFTGLIRKWLKAGIMEPDETTPWIPEKGTPQGGIISPILANIHLHHVLDLWIERRLSREYRGRVLFMRYADDIIVGFGRKAEAEDYRSRVPGRLPKFSLRLAGEKSTLVKFNRWEPDDSGRFTFPGFDFYWSRTRKNPNQRIVKRKTNRQRFRSSLAAMKQWLKSARSWPLKMLLGSLRRRLRGYWNYYCVIGNSHMTWKYHRAGGNLMFKWLNRRSQRRSFTWARFRRRWGGAWEIPRPRVREVQPNRIQGEMPLA